MPEAGPPPHAHHGEEETFVLLDGQMSFTVDGQTHDASTGTVLFVPRDVAHSYRNTGRTSEDHEHTGARIWWLTCGNAESPCWGRVTT